MALPPSLSSPGSRGLGTIRGRENGGTEGAQNRCLPTNPFSLSRDCQTGAAPAVPSPAQCCRPAGAGARQPLHSHLFLAGWGQEKEKWVRSAELSVASWAVNAWCWANPRAASGDFYTLEGWTRQQTRQQRSGGKGRKRPVMAPQMQTQVQGRQLAKESEKQRHTGGSWECGTNWKKVKSSLTSGMELHPTSIKAAARLVGVPIP